MDLELCFRRSCRSCGWGCGCCATKNFVVVLVVFFRMVVVMGLKGVVWEEEKKRDLEKRVGVEKVGE